MEPFISVIIVCYNYAHLLPRTLKSIYSQNYNKYEVIFVNNGSTDNTEEVALSWIDRHPEIQTKYIKIEKNEGPAKGDNCGAKLANGQYLMFVDADDWMDQSCLNELAAIAEKSNADRVIGSFRYINQNNETIKNMVADGDEYTRWLYTMQQSNLFKKTLYQTNNIQVHDILYLDAEKTMKFSNISTKIAFSKKILYNYYVHESTSNNNKMMNKILEDNGRYSYTEMIKILHEIYTNCTEDDKKYCLIQCIRLYYVFMFGGMRGSSYSNSKKMYKMVHQFFSQQFPEYLKDVDYSCMKKFTGSNQRKMIMKIMVILERAKLFNVVILLFIVTSKIKYITN